MFLRTNSLFRNKLGPNFNYAGHPFLLEILQKQKNSFAYIIDGSQLAQFKQYTEGVREFDSLKEKLGTDELMAKY